MLKLGVNIDHIATVRQARKAAAPRPLEGALLAEKAGAWGITAHLREDRRHIQRRDPVEFEDLGGDALRSITPSILEAVALEMEKASSISFW